MYNEHSHRISTEKDRNLLAIYSTAKVPKTTLCLGQGRKVWFPPFSNFSFQTIKGTPDWPLGSTSLHLSINAADTSALISKTTKRGQGKGLISEKKVQFWPLFFSSSSMSSFVQSNLKCMDEVNYFFRVYLSPFLYFIFLVFWFSSFFIVRNKVFFLPRCCGRLILSDWNHSALHLLHLGQHSLDTGQDFVLVGCWGDAYASHVPEKGEREEWGGRFRSADNNNKPVTAWCT